MKHHSSAFFAWIQCPPAYRPEWRAAYIAARRAGACIAMAAWNAIDGVRALES